MLPPTPGPTETPTAQSPTHPPPRPARESMQLRESVGAVRRVCANFRHEASRVVDGDFTGIERGKLGSPPGDHFRKANLAGHPELDMVIRRACAAIHGVWGLREDWLAADKAAKSCPADDTAKKAMLDAAREEVAIALQTYLGDTMQPELHECLRVVNAVH